MTILIVSIVAAVLFLGWYMWATAPICPRCGKANSKQWKYRRKDGEPDGRYANNPYICIKCGHEGDAISRSTYRTMRNRHGTSASLAMPRHAGALVPNQVAKGAQRQWKAAG